MVRSDNPKEIFSALTSSKTFAVKAVLVSARGREKKEDERNITPPLKIFDKRFALFKFAIMEKNEQMGKYIPAEANLNVDEVAGIAANSKMALYMDNVARIPVVNELLGTVHKLEKYAAYVTKQGNAIIRFLQGNSPAGTANGSASAQTGQPKLSQEQKAAIEKARSLTFFMGNLKGKTPYQVLTEDGGAPDVIAQKAGVLTNQRDYLNGQIAKYPKNRDMIDAINAALSLVDAQKGGLLPGVLEQNMQNVNPAPEQAPTGSFVLKARSVKGNQQKKDNTTGLYAATEFEIRWNLGQDYPVEVLIKNYYAPIKFHSDGRQTVVSSQMDESTLKSHSMKLTSAQWFHLLYMMRVSMDRFAIMHTKKQIFEAEEIERENMKEEEEKKRKAEEKRKRAMGQS